MLRFVRCMYPTKRTFCAFRSKSPPEKHIVWVDLELTGLDVKKHKIIEVACIITNPFLTQIHEGFHVVIHEDEKVLVDEAESWPRDHHKKTGLTDESLESKIDLKQAEQLLVDYIKTHTQKVTGKGYNLLAGNSVYMDKIFLEANMPKVHDLLNYRIIDVSSIKELCKNWFPEGFRNMPPKKRTHRALDDIKESIEELKFYKERFFIPCE